MKSFGQGRLSAIWRDGEEPELDESAVWDVYGRVFLPALRRDTRRLHDVMVGAVRPQNPLHFYDYWEGLMDVRAAIGVMSMPAVTELETGLDDIHARYLARELYGIRRAGLNVVRDREETCLPPSHPDFEKSRFECIGMDTHDALVGIGNRLLCKEGRAELYIATLQGPEALTDLLEHKWLDDRRMDDIRNLRDALYKVVMVRRLAERVETVQATRQDEPAADSAAAAMRVNNIRIVAGTGFRAA